MAPNLRQKQEGRNNNQPQVESDKMFCVVKDVKDAHSYILDRTSNYMHNLVHLITEIISVLIFILQPN